MSFRTPFALDSPTGAVLSVRRVPPAGAVRGVVLILHGLAEHAGRYARTAGELTDRGFAVYAYDHRGHGSTTAFDAPMRRFAGRKGVERVIGDVRAVCDLAARDWPDMPLVVFGHSMGGLIGLSFARRHGEALAGLAVWNAEAPRAAQEAVGRLGLRAEKALKGSDVGSRLFARATFEAWGRAIRPRRTGADWLSHDARVVDDYLVDPLCGWTPTISMAEDILRLAAEAGDRKALAALPPALPIHLLGGGADPATHGGAGVRTLGEALLAAGSLDVTCTIVPGARHETLNETEPFRAPAVTSLDTWLDRLALH